MKTVGVIFLVFACVAARGSGPYLPSGWKPDGPSFYLPSEVSKPLKEPVKEIVFSESEASGSDFLREYGPPKVQEISQDISQQGLPDVVNEQLFISPVVKTVAKENSNVVTEITEEKLEVKSEVKMVEEPIPVTESQSVSVTESIANTEEEALQVNVETTTLADAAESVDAVHEFGYLVEPTDPTVAIIALTEKVNNEANVQLENQVTGAIAVETQKLINEQQESVQLVRQDEVTDKIVTIQVTSGTEESTIDVREPAESSSVESATSTQRANFDIISTVTEKAETVEGEVRKVEEIIQNIPELIVSLENEVKAKQAETIEEVPALVIKEIFGSVDQAPEGFLEYGPPGFTEYGPPREDLRENTIEEKIPETQSTDNFVRRRRFSPKIRSSRKQLH